MDRARERNLSASSGYDGKWREEKQKKSENTFSVKTRENDEPSSYDISLILPTSNPSFALSPFRNEKEENRRRKNANANERKSNSPRHAFVRDAIALGHLSLIHGKELNTAFGILSVTELPAPASFIVRFQADYRHAQTMWHRFNKQYDIDLHICEYFFFIRTNECVSCLHHHRKLERMKQSIVSASVFFLLLPSLLSPFLRLLSFGSFILELSWIWHTRTGSKMKNELQCNSTSYTIMWK